jgi:serine/threonine protein kinase
MKFSYTSGQRPLEGYTLKRGIGRGGFGEVYYALSDGGKEVALKLVRGDLQIELRGVAQCLNLKHPNLVALFDLRTDAHGDHWVVMEYVAGEPLGAVISRHPAGLPKELTREWFLGISRAVAYLHDHGIVHRDLKPGNVFIENGTVKIGDYGLSKSIGASHRTAQTQSVGTVHYMAPEISTGNYNKQIDVYAAGVILFEMVTGRVPFDGESAGEILMKHLTSPPDLSKVPGEWKPIISKALSKNPAHRYASMAEMGRDVEALGQPSPSRPAAPRVVELADAPADRPRPAPPAKPVDPVLSAMPAVTFRQQLLELSWSMVLTVIFAALATALWGALRADPNASHIDNLTQLSSLFFLTIAASWAILMPGKFWTERRGDSWTRRIVMLALGGAVGLFACWLDGWSPGQTWRLPEAVSESGVRLFPTNVAIEASYISYYALAFFVLRWWRMTSRRRSTRFSFAPLLGAGFWGVVLLLLIRPQHSPSSVLAAVVVVMTAAIVQLVSPWEEPPARQPARRVRLRYA